MQYTVVHSKDPYLLARLATDLQMENKKFTPAFEDPFIKYKKYLTIYEWCEFGFYTHDCNPQDRFFKLDDTNYIKVLTQILEP